MTEDERTQVDTAAGGDAVAGTARGAESPESGEKAADAATAELDSLDQRPLSEHAAVFEQVHGRLQASLAEIDNA